MFKEQTAHRSLVHPEGNVQSCEENHSEEYLELQQSCAPEQLNNGSMNQAKFNELEEV